MKHKTGIVFWAILLGFSLSLVSFDAAIAGNNDDALQCMADCMIKEGYDAKDICKQQCSKIQIDMNQHQNKDCMAIYKQCKKDCDGDNVCRKTCKTNLLNCV